MKKKNLLVLCLLVFISLSSCGIPPAASEKSELPESKHTPASPTTAIPEISSENTTQCVDFAVQNGRIYYRNYYDDEKLYRVNTDGRENRKLSDEQILQFYVADDEIYYVNGSDGRRLYAINIDGSDRRKLSDGSADTFFRNLSDGKIYYESGDDDSLYSINTDGSGKEKISGGNALYTIGTGDRIYYSPVNRSNRGIFSIKTDGSNKIKLSDDHPFRLEAVNDRIYWLGDHKLYAMRNDGSDRCKLTDDYALNINVAGGRIYYRNIFGGESTVCSMNTDGSDKQLLSHENANWLTVWNSRIYYMVTGANIYSMNLDGSNRQLILNVEKNGYRDAAYEVIACLREDMPEYRFVATGKIRVDNGTMGYIMGLNAYDENGRSIISADFSEANYDEVIGSPIHNKMMDTMGLHIVDVNFDGYKDVIILNSFRGNRYNMWYNCWLWDLETSSFIESESFLRICNPALDPDKKCIYSKECSDADTWGGSIYNFTNGEFVMINNLDTYKDGLTETKLVNGKMEVVRQVTYTNDNELLEAEIEYYKDSGLWQLGHPHWYCDGGHQADEWLGGNAGAPK